MLPQILGCLHRACSSCIRAELTNAQSAATKSKKRKKNAEAAAVAGPFLCPHEWCTFKCDTAVEELLVDFGASTTTIGGGFGAKKRAARQCDVCEDDIATRYCGDCKKISFFCNDCFEPSHKKAKNVSHQSTTVEERLKAVGSETAQVPLALCKVHQEPLKLYCDDCDKVACFRCGTFGASHTLCFSLMAALVLVHLCVLMCASVCDCMCLLLLEFLHVGVSDPRLLYDTLNVNGSSFVFVSSLNLNELFSVVNVVVQTMRAMRFRCWMLLIAPSAKRSVKVSPKQSR
jgi:hypothetical protein